MITRSIVAVPPPGRGLHPYARWIAAELRPGQSVLNVGAGRNHSGILRPVLRRSPYVVGIDPDASINRNPTLDERHQQRLEDFAADNAERFDVVFSVYVLEHVTDPDRFLAACAQVLRPGGVHFGLTLNMHQYFGLLTWASSRLGVAEPLLRRMKGEETLANYHFPTHYRLNSIGRLTRGLDRVGFGSVEFRCYDQSKRYAWYLPESLAWFSTAYTRAVYALHAPRLMGHLSFRAVLGGADHEAVHPSGGAGREAGS
ncbi:MAG: methyltransferase domain-containing protein [Nocardioidaceae bacterium]